ncbi:MAG: helix-turn-helix transcriptional regulator [Cyclobacteriaceae bacterium]|nr:helix-turn-helix transcriptional regulator [Cyclobacteriaceae bacterium]
MRKRTNPDQKLNRIWEVLQEKEKTQAWLAGQLDIEFRTVNRYVNNHRQPNLRTLFEIARILKINPKELLNS